ISALIVEEGGKIQQLAEVEVAFTADYIDYMAEWARRYEGEIIQSDRPGENILLFKRALGVTTGILPWNFPFFLIARKMAPALLTGNTIVHYDSWCFTPNSRHTLVMFFAAVAMIFSPAETLPVILTIATFG
ncbi:hypothetical protein QQ73_08995, partial [Candidatus Endoriftia persephone str. Guaymas]|nr:hypothetical protein [Candidatus Endoriftia persephone str. Guaymas]